jgi:hypothetical protein
MSLDISPDGKSLVFDHMGDLYSIPAAGGKAQNITKGLAFDTHQDIVQMEKSFCLFQIEVVRTMFG